MRVLVLTRKTALEREMLMVLVVVPLDLQEVEEDLVVVLVSVLVRTEAQV